MNDRQNEFVISDGQSIRIKLLNGDVRELRNVTFTGEEGAGERYELDRYVEELDSVLIKQVGYESFGYLLVSRKTGSEIKLDAPPILSPDGNEFLTASWTEATGYRENRLQIWKREGDSFTPRFTYQPEGYGVKEARWINGDMINATKKRAGGVYIEVPVEISRKNGVWVPKKWPCEFSYVWSQKESWGIKTSNGELQDVDALSENACREYCTKELLGAKESLYPGTKVEMRCYFESRLVYSEYAEK